MFIASRGLVFDVFEMVIEGPQSIKRDAKDFWDFVARYSLFVYVYFKRCVYFIGSEGKWRP